MFEDTSRVVFPKEDVGLVVPTDRNYIPYVGGKWPMKATPATFEQLNHVLEAGIKSVGTGAADGVGTDKIYDYPFPESALNTLKTYTLENGDNNVMKEGEYGFVTDFNLAGKCGEAWMISSNWQVRQLSITSFTGALSIPTVEEMLFSKTKLYIDLISGTYGTTQKSATLLEANLKVKTGWVATCPGDGQLYYRSIQFSREAYEVALDITFEYETTAAAEEAFFLAKTARKIQLKCEGTAVGTPGTTYTYKTMIINLPGKWSKFSPLGVKDGNSIVTGTFLARYNATAADAGNILVVNELASVP